jgi:hypothetical protein
MTKKTLVALFLVLAVLFVSLSPAAPVKDKAEVVGLAVRQEQGNLLASFHLENCFTSKMEEAVLSGVTTTFRIRVVLEKSGCALIQPSVLNLTLEHSVKYDLLKKEFRVRLPEHPDGVCYTKDFEEAKRLMSTVRDLPVMPLRRLEKDRNYVLRIKAELSRFKLPLFLRYIFFFVSLWDFETDWQETPFSF